MTTAFSTFVGTAGVSVVAAYVRDGGARIVTAKRARNNPGERRWRIHRRSDELIFARGLVVEGANGPDSGIDRRQSRLQQSLISRLDLRQFLVPMERFSKIRQVTVIAAAERGSIGGRGSENDRVVIPQRVDERAGMTRRNDDHSPLDARFFEGRCEVGPRQIP